MPDVFASVTLALRDVNSVAHEMRGDFEILFPFEDYQKNFKGT